ncbi:FAD/NAD(P)-binding domain-containing protein [Daldinia caldariorum]|uniref:FAD/NAD(P)-binding domain-containing protein n=1 Tax=Daldinia caldariorum TaxID=326644 RepID=UPI00200873E9|nr:FAD/NAD(P)-binding domain-containing protein [Daldinia caldariorum]KAI1472934.1 FAD/NAD(P)-binding domain-containing protein [Daldinia caldariorum]
MPANVLIIGAGICGPALATLLRRSDPENRITVVERYPGIRHNGLQIDLRAWGVPIMKRLGLIEAVKEKVVHESGITFVNSKGREYGLFGATGTGTGQQSFTSDFEILRGDLSEILYQASLTDVDTKTGDKKVQDAPDSENGPVKYIFGTTVTRLEQDDKGVDATFSDGQTRRYDLVVGADGQWSRTRRMMFGEEEGIGMFKRMRIYIAYFKVPKLPEDGDVARFYHAGQGRSIATRSADRPFTQVYMMMGTDSEEVRRGIERQPVEEQKATFEKIFRGSGWTMDRFLKGMAESTDFYADSIGQVKAPRVVKGRIALLGDAGYCAAPVTGMGTTVSLIGAWILAGELARHNGDVPAALDAYDARIRPYIEEAHKLLPGVPKIHLLESSWAIALFHIVVAVFSFFKIDKLLARLMPEDKGGIPVPEYPELKGVYPA